ncbi:acetyl-coenzyme A synthetase [Raineyella antarctica]|uniref:Acetate--CoA ligase n=1 Tax=Raineyella antarctica TaxID=1577474 RepID=A0A1G6GFZ6_9ACTN|nr:acetate--CoA ligase [Raineyella antarctica]SDB80880.1 acetyl-coenzyme A synthetase [Raineyella antarctica]
MVPENIDLVPPSRSVVEQASVPDPEALGERAGQDPLAFWAAEAAELEWSEPWEQVLDDSAAPFFTWFPGGRTNIVRNAVDRHLAGPRKNKLALIWVSEDGKETRTYSFHALNRQVTQMANVLKAMGVGKGDIVTIYLPRIPEIWFAMLACAKIGAVHSVVFGGYSADALRDRIDASESKLVITADGSWINGSVFPMKDVIDEAIRFSPTVENLVVVRRTGSEVTMDPLRDHWYGDLTSLPIAKGPCPTEPMAAEDPLFLLYTSGSTGQPKAIVHAHGGYQVGTYATTKYVFDIRDEDRYWCTADPGWVTGHSYGLYGPLLNGATSFMFEGGPTFPYPNRWWSLIEYYGISIFYTAPTAIRSLMRFGKAWPNRHDLSSLRLLGSVGEPINPEAWHWFHEVIGGGECPIMDTWWQTETGMFQICPQPVMPLKPGSAGRPFYGQEVAVLDEQGNEVPTGAEGMLVLKHPWPAMFRGLYHDDQRYIDTYWSKYPGYYLTGDSARIDEDGYVWIVGRADDVIKVSGHRIGTAEVEAAMDSHPDVVEAAVVGLPHEVKGQSIHAYAVLRPGANGSQELAEAIRLHVAQHLSPIAKPDGIDFVESLPKTRSGKIMRRVLKAQALGEDVGDLSTMDTEA